MKYTSMIAALSATALVIASSASAQSIAGQYRCYSYNIGGSGGSCRIAPPLALNADGTYQISSEKGTYKLKDGYIELSASKIRGPGKLEGGNKITFSYDFKGMHHTVTYLCMSCAG